MSNGSTHVWTFEYNEKEMNLAQGIRHARNLREQIKDLHDTKTDRFTSLSLWGALVLTLGTVLVSPLKEDLFVAAVIASLVFSFLIAAGANMLLQAHLPQKYRHSSQLESKIDEHNAFTEALRLEVTEYLKSVYEAQAEEITVEDIIYGGWSNMEISQQGCEHKCYAVLTEDSVILMDCSDSKELATA